MFARPEEYVFRNEREVRRDVAYLNIIKRLWAYWECKKSRNRVTLCKQVKFDLISSGYVCAYVEFVVK